MQKWACGNWQGICGPFCNDDTNERGLRFLVFATFNDLVFANTSGRHKASRRWTWHSPNWQHHSQIDYILVRKRFRSGMNIARTRNLLVDIGSDHDLLMMTFHLRLKRISKPKKNKTQVWPRKAERSQCVGNLPSYDGREVCTSNHHKQWRYRPGFNDHHLQHSSDWNSNWDPWQISSEENILGHCRYSWSLRQKEITEKKTIWTWRIWEIQGSEQQHQEVHEKDKRKVDGRTV